MDIAEFAKLRYTTKAFDPSRKIPAELFAQLRALLRNSPSSVNSQPWHFIVADDEAGKARVAKAAEGAFAYNAPKILKASHVVVLCVKKTLDAAHLEAIIEQEDREGRFLNPEAKAGQAKSRAHYVDLHQNVLKDESWWMEKQLYIVLGGLLLGAATLGIDACPMEGVDTAALDREFGLEARDLRALMVVGLGYRGEDDFNAKLPKSRLPEEVLFSRA